MQIREARRSDWPLIEALARSAYHDDYETAGDFCMGIESVEDELLVYKEEFDSIGSRFLVALEGERALGMIIVRLPEPGRAWIDDLLVAPEARRGGIAAELISAAVPPEAEVRCEVNLKNQGGLKLFDSLGFERVVETVSVLRRAP